MREVALFGGAFDPPHLGHVWVTATVLATEPVDQVWLVPTHTHAFGKDMVSFEARAEMCRAVAGIFGGRVAVSEVEAELAAAGRRNRTAETLEWLVERHPDVRFAWIVGSDLVEQMDRWARPDRIRELARIIVVNREGHGEDAGPAIPDVSSTEVRRRLRAGRPVDRWVPRPVAEVIARDSLYR